MLLNASMAETYSTKKAQKKPITMAENVAPPKSSEDFSELLHALGQEKNKEAFIALFDHFAPRVKSFLMKGGASPEAADELAQETMLTVWNKADKYDPKQAAASTWIFTIARNKRIDALRKTKRHDPNPSDPLLLEDDAPSPRDNAIQKQDTSVIADALEKLPEEQADLIRKSFFEDKSHAVIAEETGIPLGTVKSRIRLALERLRKQTKVQDIWQ